MTRHSVVGIFHVWHARWSTPTNSVLGGTRSAPPNKKISRSQRLLEERGTRLGYPYSSKIEASKHAHMRELRVQHRGRPYRLLFAFDPRRTAILLIGGDKTGDDRWYDEHVPQADRLYDEHLAELADEDEGG